jgi:uncharacterized surface protein with fasciclin (FAS1) repeats
VSQQLGGLAAIALLMATACVAPSEDGSAVAPVASPAAIPIVGGAPMYPNRTIVQNAGSSRDHTTLVRLVQAAGLSDALGAPGPYTVFAPTNGAFDKLPHGLVQTLLDPANKSLLAKILNYHVVPGRRTSSQIGADIRAGGGSATYTSTAGGMLRARMEGNAVILSDVKGARSRMTQTDVMQSNGIIHVVDAVLLPTI